MDDYGINKKKSKKNIELDNNNLKWEKKSEGCINSYNKLKLMIINWLIILKNKFGNRKNWKR